MGFDEYSIEIVANIIVLLSLFYTIIEFHAMDEKHSTTFASESESGFYV